ncbi:MAG: galactose oxidase, partial [Meiothermus sp.]
YNATSAGDPSHQLPVNQYSAEIYYPPYMFKADGSLAPRPTIVSAPQTVSYGSTFTVETAQPNSTIARVTINKLGAATHAFNMGQHFVPLTSSKDGTNKLSVNAPASPNIAPPGYYMLFVLDTKGVPSAAKFVKVGP